MKRSTSASSGARVSGVDPMPTRQQLSSALYQLDVGEPVNWLFGHANALLLHQKEVRRRDSSGTLRVILIREDANVGDPPTVAGELCTGEHILGSRTP